MADDKKISELTALAAGSVADTDEFEVVDKDDTTDAASGTNKRFTWSSFKTAIASFYDSATRTLTNKTIDTANNTLTVVEADISDLTHTDADAIHDNVSGEIAAVTEKTTPVDADVVLIEDSAATNAKKRLSWANIKATLASATQTLTNKTINTASNTITVNEADISDLDHNDADAIHDNVSAEISAITQKATPVAGDHFLIEDSADSNVKKRSTLGNIIDVIATAIKDGGADEIDVAEFGSGAATTDQVPKADGAGGVAWGDAGGGGETRATFSANFETNTRYLRNTAGSGSISFDQTGVYLDTVSTSGSSCNVRSSMQAAASTIPGFDMSPIFSALIRHDTYTPTSSIVFVGIGSLTVNGTGITMTGKQMGYKYIATAGPTDTFYATNANGTTETATDITSDAPSKGGGTVFTASMDGSTDIKFYVNGTLAATHTTNLPSGTTSYMQAAISNQSTTQRDAVAISNYSSSFKQA